MMKYTKYGIKSYNPVHQNGNLGKSLDVQDSADDKYATNTIKFYLKKWYHVFEVTKSRINRGIQIYSEHQ